MRRGPSLSGKLVRLRPFTSEDISGAYLGWLNDPLVTRFSNQRFRRHDRTSSLAYLASFEGTDNLFMSMRRLADDSAIGTMTAYLSRHHGTVDVGIMVGDRTAWGKGYGQDGWNVMLDWLAGLANIRKITAGTAAPNIGMQRLMERSGMTLEARRIGQEIIEGKPEDILYYARFLVR
ncbi:MAG: GNAT family N-acetyltransferase [Devosia marina]|uniref:GNAT family N-acetyltransferase n=1 Tax=Devosia marina TaxID=2683198 RepID=UPI0032EFC0BE